MNKILQQKVKDKCKDMGLSEAYVNAITEKMGGSVADDSTDETAIENVANQIMEIARLSQGEATRWVDKNKSKQEPPKQEPPKQEPPKQEPPRQEPPRQELQQQPQGEPEWFKTYREAQEARIKQLETQNANLAAERAKAERTASIKAAYAKHNIPEPLREYVYVPDSVEASAIDGFVAGMAQKIVALQLPKLPHSVQAPTGEVTKEQTDAIAKSMLPGHAAKKDEK